MCCNSTFMSKDNSKDFASDLLKSLFRDSKPPVKLTLQDLFNKRLQELDLKPTNVLEILNIEYRTLNGIIEGTQRRIDIISLIKIADFLQISKEQAVALYLDALEGNFSNEISHTSNKIAFIRDNFDLSALKKAGFIESVSDFSAIENKICQFLGLDTITDYVKPLGDVAFSASLIVPKNELTRSFWINSAYTYFESISNPNEFNRDALVDFFPNIRWYSMDVENGLMFVIRELYRMGVTVVYQQTLPTLHLRGATFALNQKPCIVITNYVGFYPTLWFALVHELFHVIFDWDEILQNNYHLSDEEFGQLSVKEKEDEADTFAREFLFSKSKVDSIKYRIRDDESVEEFAKANHVHPSFVYVFHAYDYGKRDKSAWAIAKRKNPNLESLLTPFTNSWADPLPVSEFAKSMKMNVYKQ